MNRPHGTWGVVRVNDSGAREVVRRGLSPAEADRVAGQMRDRQTEADIAAGWNVLPQRVGITGQPARKPPQPESIQVGGERDTGRSVAKPGRKTMGEHGRAADRHLADANATIAALRAEREQARSRKLMGGPLSDAPVSKTGHVGWMRRPGGTRS
jgi:hypothetical protein